MVADRAYSAEGWRPGELEHRYGPRVHVLSEPFLLTQLAALCARNTVQPRINSLIETCYRHLFGHVFSREFPLREQKIETRMAEHTHLGRYEGVILDPEVRAVTVNIARAGTFPSHLCFQMMNEFLNPEGVRQDHIVMERATDEAGHVTGADLLGAKIGGGVEDCILVFPDPMGATGSSLSRAIDHYREHVAGTPRKIITVHMIITPNYVRAMSRAHPEVEIYAIRLDRGLSPPDVLRTVPGERWQEENGLDDHQYIVPGGGGFGEILNNAFS